jgi:hypothetical protein
MRRGALTPVILLAEVLLQPVAGGAYTPDMDHAPYVDYVWTARSDLDAELREKITQAFVTHTEGEAVQTCPGGHGTG